ncbi:MAG TPA: insulinase family protein, partial [Candidatus Paceibacterota bacterium]
MSYAKKVRTKTLPSGARFFATPFPSRDIVSISGSIKGGARLAGSSEFANIHAAMLLEGTSKRSKKEIQEYLDTIGASLSFSSSSDRLNFSGYARPHNIPKLVALVAEILMHASFPSRELSVLKKRETANLTYAAQDTRTQAGI